MQKINENEKYENLSFITSSNKFLIDIKRLNDILEPNTNHGLCGSKNLGNTCYMNSSIACISNCTELTTFFLTKEYRKYINSSNKNGLKGRLADAWYYLLKEYWKTDRQRGNPSDIKSLMGKKYKKYNDNEQHDANEFIIMFLELLGEDLNEIKNKKYLELKEQQPKETDEQCAKRYWELHLSRNNSVINQLFCGLYKSTIICPLCKYKSITYNPFTSLSLLIPNREQLIKVKYLNFSKEDIFIYYIPKFSLAKTYKIYIRVEKDISFKSILYHIPEKIKEFPFEIRKVDFMSVTNKEITNIIKGDEIYDKFNKVKKAFYFAVERDFYYNKESIFIPIYIKIGDTLSAYPRVLFVYSGMPYKYLKKKIYFVVRKYFKSLIKDLKKNDIDTKIKELYFNYSKNTEEILIKAIGKEYDELLKVKNKYQLNFPYDILIQKNVDSEKSTLIFDGENDIFQNLTKFQIISNESNIDLLVDDLRKLNDILIVNVNTKTGLFRKSISENIDVCNVLKSNDYCNRDYIEDNNITLNDCLTLFNIEENLESGNEWLCNVCKNRVNARKKLDFFYLPKILCICLSRFKKTEDDDYIKDQRFVDFPLKDLNMNKYMIFNDGKNYIYDIFAVCEHYGGREGGHYTAICKNIDGEWYSYDDSVCSHSSKDNVCTRSAYILFYRRKDW